MTPKEAFVVSFFWIPIGLLLVLMAIGQVAELIQIAIGG
jgi:hypothetical protein